MSILELKERITVVKNRVNSYLQSNLCTYNEIIKQDPYYTLTLYKPSSIRFTHSPQSIFNVHAEQLKILQHEQMLLQNYRSKLLAQNQPQLQVQYKTSLQNINHQRNNIIQFAEDINRTIGILKFNFSAFVKNQSQLFINDQQNENYKQLKIQYQHLQSQIQKKKHKQYLLKQSCNIMQQNDINIELPKIMLNLQKQAKYYKQMFQKEREKNIAIKQKLLMTQQNIKRIQNKKKDNKKYYKTIKSYQTDQYNANLLQINVKMLNKQLDEKEVSFAEASKMLKCLKQMNQAKHLETVEIKQIISQVQINRNKLRKGYITPRSSSIYRCKTSTSLDTNGSEYGLTTKQKKQKFQRKPLIHNDYQQ